MTNYNYSLKTELFVLIIDNIFPQFYSRQRYAEEICGIRSEFQYNNQMYVMAGELIGLLANKSYTELVNY